jgi:hypothetical protein
MFDLAAALFITRVKSLGAAEERLLSAELLSVCVGDEAMEAGEIFWGGRWSI